jgi:hypothetical protein
MHVMGKSSPIKPLLLLEDLEVDGKLKEIFSQKVPISTC